MTKFLFSSDFSGGGGSSLGAIAAGFKVLLGVEWDKEIASLYRRNIGEVIVGDVGKVSLMQRKKFIPLRRKPDEILVHQTSPPCQEYSNANQNKDLTSERATVLKETFAFYRMFQPEYVVLENVPAYQKADVYLEFKKFLWANGYAVCFDEVVNCAAYGLPQTRKRLIMIAVKDGYWAVKPSPTHTKQTWIGWHEAIENLIPGLEDSWLTEKQKRSLAIVSENTKSVLVDSANSRGDGGYTTKVDQEPAFTICASWGKSNSKPRAVLVERVGYRGSPKARSEGSPAWTLKANIGNDGKGANRVKMIDLVLEDGVETKVKTLNTRALARLQGFPDSYQFSGRTGLDVKVIGNSFPPTVMEIICNKIKQSVTMLVGSESF
ncbi:MAG: DNA (cytosine-5-)-methyltransferase [Nostoc sp.]|uniref:DNA cytosine methyltransferase n=1 Tax=Nostoc sp. TaxID=1180 RepID=UPI002FEFDD23